MRQIKKAVFPVAGLGTRFLPATKVVPKELLPVVDKPLIQYAVEEAYAAGIREMIFVTASHKRAIEDHFDKSPSLEQDLLQKQKSELLEIVRSIAPVDVSFIYVRQSEALGLGHAVLCAKHIVGDEPFAVILPDDLIDAETPAIGQLIKCREQMGGGNVLAIQEIPIMETRQYGVVSPGEFVKGSYLVKGIIEKPAPEVAPSTMAVVGRYVFEPSIFDSLENTDRGVGGEIQLTDAISESLKLENTFAFCFEGTRFDCGSKQGFLDATIAFAKKMGYRLNGC